MDLFHDFSTLCNRGKDEYTAVRINFVAMCQTTLFIYNSMSLDAYLNTIRIVVSLSYRNIKIVNVICIFYTPTIILLTQHKMYMKLTYLYLETFDLVDSKLPYDILTTS